MFGSGDPISRAELSTDHIICAQIIQGRKDTWTCGKYESAGLFAS